MDLRQKDFKMKELREDNDLFQKDIAKFLDVPKETYSSWENQYYEPPMEQCNKLANYYHVTLDYLLGLSPNHKYVKNYADINWDIFIKRLRKCRKDKHYTQAFVGDKMGFPQTTYSNFENGINKPTAFKVVIMAKFFNTSIDYLFGRNNNPVIDITNSRNKSIKL